ncbi:MAG: sensor histidine kinase [Anaerolineales bacterium]|nr:sensor histidine kinase [Anaerolineales bacterium]
MDDNFLLLIFFLYGLAFFSMGLIVALESGRTTDERLHHALRPLAAFGLIHGVHEWIELSLILDVLPFQHEALEAYYGLRTALLAFSFLSLSAFGASLLSTSSKIRRLSLLLPVVMGAVWGFGALVLRNDLTIETGLLDTADVWSRYVLGIPSSLIASAGLIAQQRAFRLVGMAQFGRDALWAAIAFVWYGVVGQLFVHTSSLPPSNTLNDALFAAWFGFPIQVVRAVTAGIAAAFVVRFLRASEVEKQRQIASLQAARLQEAEEREIMRGEMLKQIVAAQESERQRIARELHDETGQALTAIGLGLRGVATALPENTQSATQNLRRLEFLVSHSLTELQRLIADLRPSHLDDLGLPAALRWYAGEVSQRAPLNVHVEIRGEERPLPAPLKIALFRVAQEALNNIVKHAKAHKIDVLLHYEAEEVSIRVQDDGVGFEVESLPKKKRSSWGVVGMNERANLLGGRFEIQSRPGVGTRVEIMIPYQQGGEENLLRLEP